MAGPREGWEIRRDGHRPGRGRGHSQWEEWHEQQRGEGICRSPQVEEHWEASWHEDSECPLRTMAYESRETNIESKASSHLTLNIDKACQPGQLALSRYTESAVCSSNPAPYPTGTWLEYVSQAPL